VELYSATKAFGERLGKSLADQYGMSVICLRIGAVWPGDNSPKGKRSELRRPWLSTRDFCQAVEKAIRVSGIGFAALFVTSDNEDKPFDLSETCRALGYEPQDGVRAARRSLPAKIRHAVERRLRRFLRRGDTAH
jgi:nucleoside-diphosphate-sugar epimerase